MLHNKNITSLESVISSLEDAWNVTYDMGDRDLYEVINDTLASVHEQLTALRSDCMFKTLECVEKMDEIIEKVWADLDKPCVEVWEAKDFQDLYTDATDEIFWLRHSYCQKGADPDFLDRQIVRILLELDVAIPEDVRERPEPTGVTSDEGTSVFDLFPDLDDDFPF